MAEDAKRRLNNIGYIHPDENMTNRDPKYELFNEEEKENKKVCPVCKELSVITVNDMYKTKICKNSHRWSNIKKEERERLERLARLARLERERLEREEGEVYFVCKTNTKK